MIQRCLRPTWNLLWGLTCLHFNRLPLKWLGQPSPSVRWNIGMIGVNISLQIVSCPCLFYWPHRRFRASSYAECCWYMKSSQAYRNCSEIYLALQVSCCMLAGRFLLFMCNFVIQASFCSILLLFFVCLSVVLMHCFCLGIMFSSREILKLCWS